ncbi:hypothetical protein H0H81_008113 [Sphagnurus paluster]|uniref:Peptide N-acetyl-beta-D-glucosaminyl asparaginase amidase A N-terminal domain-containing protein n=1 Tax=Sphagnurus paluster TaxID=117069 RepID=A0A9P7GR26_9AGAR|nr:hypothetical protein H0H81_008113 [Sphagnurus paluster]
MFLRPCQLLVISCLHVAVYGAVLRNFQVTQPVVVPDDAKQCTIKVLQPPTDCGPLGSWAAITLNLTVTSNGTQYDRLAHFTFQNVEIWRTSTPEPTIGDGIIWTYIKDVSRYTPLFANPGTFILQLDNIVEPGLDGIYSSKMLNVTLPRNTVKVFAELLASGNAEEEFWYFNAANEYLSTLPQDTTYGQGPFRELRLLIDGKIAGAALPYPVIFTGGLNPSLWRPITAYGALDLPTYFLDVTPFVPLLTDGNPHQFTIDVVSAEDDHTILQNWYVSGLLQVITDPSLKPTTGHMTVYDAPLFSQTSTTAVVQPDNVNITVKATRKLHIEANILSGSGEATYVVWKQDLSYSNEQSYIQDAQYQIVTQRASGSNIATHNGVPSVVEIFSYPLYIDLAFSADQTSFTTVVDHSYDRDLLPDPLVVRSKIEMSQITNGFFQVETDGNFANGTSNNTFAYEDLAGNTYTREVDAALNNITFDREGGTLAHTGTTTEGFQSISQVIKYVLGRLPGGNK